MGYQYCGNQIAQYSLIDNDNLLNYTYDNIVKSKTSSLTVFANWLLLPKTRLMTNTTIGYTNLRSDRLDMRNNGWTANAFVNLQQTMPWNIMWSIGGILQSKNYTLQGYSSGMSFFYTNLSKTLVKDKLDISLNFVTPLSNKLEITSEVRGADYINKTDVLVPIRQVGLTLTYKFGNSKRQFQQKKSNISNDFQEQKSGMQGVGNIGGK